MSFGRFAATQARMSARKACCSGVNSRSMDAVSDRLDGASGVLARSCGSGCPGRDRARHASISATLQPMNDSLRDIAAELGRFASERDWAQFHSPKNLASALVVEAGEL